LKLTEISDAELADKFGDLDAKQDKLAEDMKALREEYERRGLTFAQGERWKVTKDKEPNRRFDSEGAKAALGARAAEFYKDGFRTKWLVRAVEAP
jgi:hypothetical protein